MMKFFLKPLIFIIFILFSLTSFSFADGHSIKDIIISLKKEIIVLGETRVKRKTLQPGREYIEDLRVQKEALEKEKAKQAKIDAIKNEIIMELEKLGEKPLSYAKDIDTDEEIIALRKQLDELKARVQKEEKEKLAKEKKLAEEKLAKEKKLAEEKKIEEEKKRIEEEKKKIENEIKLAKEELVNELKKLGQEPVVAINEIDSNSDIIALRYQLKKIKDEIQKQKDAKKKEEETKQARSETVQQVKKEILFLGETPISEFEVTNNDEYIAALNNQLEQIRQLKEEEEKEIQQSIPNWFIKLPKGTEKMLYVRGTAVVDTLQGSIDSATNAALRQLGKKLETRLNSKIKETVRQAGIGEDQVTKSEMNRVSTLVVKEVTISGYEIAENKLVKLDNGSYRSFVLLEYPTAQVYKAFINKVEKNEKLKSSVKAIKNTEAFKELEQYVAEFSGA